MQANQESQPTLLTNDNSDTLLLWSLYNDQELLLTFKEGSEAAMRTIYHSYFKKLYLSAYSLLRDAQFCEDIVQEVFVSFWQKRETLEITHSLSAYLFTATRFQVLTYIRKGKANHITLFGQLEERIWGEPIAENLLYQKELKAKVAGIVDSMPGKMREVYLLSRTHQLSHKEIAARLDISIKTVETQIRNALIRIRHCLVT